MHLINKLPSALTDYIGVRLVEYTMAWLQIYLLVFRIWHEITRIHDSLEENTIQYCRLVLIVESFPRDRVLESNIASFAFSREKFRRRRFQNGAGLLRFYHPCGDENKRNCRFWMTTDSRGRVQRYFGFHLLREN